MIILLYCLCKYMYRFVRFLNMRMKEKEYIKPGILKFGIAVALSLGGIIYYFLRAKRIRPLHSPPSSPSSSDIKCVNDNRIGSEGEADEQEHEDSRLLGRYNGDKNVFILPEFNELVDEFDLASIKECDSPTKDGETFASDTESPTGYKALIKNDYYEQEIKNLRNMIKTLKERERALEIQLLEYYGLKEQETAVMEIHNRLRINSMEAKLFSLKIESLQADNRRLEAQVSDYAKVVADLEVARAKVKMLNRKLKSESEHNKEHISALQQKVKNLQEHEQMTVAKSPDIQPKLQTIQLLEEEVEELRKSNSSLQLENSDLGRRLDYAQILANSVLESEETEALKEENQHLKKQNEDLTKEVEQFKENRCTDVEELVYLRWINACLRYELRNYKPGPGETAARDLSKTLSPKSEEKAKQLILKYANKEGLGLRRTRSAELDIDQSTPSQASVLTGSDLDDSPLDHSFPSKTHPSSKKKVFGKLLKLLRHGHHHTRGSSHEDTKIEADVVERDSPLFSSGISTSEGHGNKSRTSSLSSSIPSLESPARPSFDSLSRHSLESSSRLSSSRSWDFQKSPYIQRSKAEKTDSFIDFEGAQKKSAGADSSYTSSKFGSISEGGAEASNEESENSQNFELYKYAEALQESHGKTSEFTREKRSTSLDLYTTL